MAAMETAYVLRGWVEMKDSGSRSAGVIPGGGDEEDDANELF